MPKTVPTFFRFFWLKFGSIKKLVNVLFFFYRVSSDFVPRPAARPSRWRTRMWGGRRNPDRVHQRRHPHRPRPARGLLPRPLQVLPRSPPGQLTAAQVPGHGPTRSQAEAGAEVLRAAADTDGDVQHGTQGRAHRGPPGPPGAGVDVPAQELLPAARRHVLQPHLHRRPPVRPGHQAGQARNEEPLILPNQQKADRLKNGERKKKEKCSNVKFYFFKRKLTKSFEFWVRSDRLKLNQTRFFYPFGTGFNANLLFWSAMFFDNPPRNEMKSKLNLIMFAA